MLGYDLQFAGKRRHWHGDHPKGLGNCGTLPKWQHRFNELKRHLNARRVQVVNCTRSTALDGYPRADLEDALAGRGATVYRRNRDAA